MIQIAKITDNGTTEIWWLASNSLSYEDIGYAIERFLKSNTDAEKGFCKIDITDYDHECLGSNSEAVCIPFRYATFKFQYSIKEKPVKTVNNPSNFPDWP